MKTLKERLVKKIIEYFKEDGGMGYVDIDDDLEATLDGTYDLNDLAEKLLKAVEDYYLESESLGKFIEDLSDKDKQVSCSLNKFLSNLRNK